MGTVGRALPGIELYIAEDGEILAKGPNIMPGYYNLPEKTAEAIDGDGWFHTGDIGAIDEEGFLRITDRKKELIVNAYGKNVAPAPLENRLKASMFIAEAVVIGDQRKFLSVLMVPDFEALEAWAAREGITFADRSELLGVDAVQELFKNDLEQANRHPETAKYERIHAFHLLGGEFSVETGELTPTQKVKRRIIRDKFAAEIESMYSEAEKS
jgi:long-chain acyl-CoA synthetase